MDAGMVYDAKEGYVLLFGGCVGITSVSNYSSERCFNDTWMFRSDEWTNLSIPGPPSAASPAMAYDPQVGGVVAYITSNATDWVNQTWEFTGGKWTRLNIPEPDLTGGSTAVYDPADRAILLFGSHGLPNGTWVEETWEFSVGEWHHIQSNPTPYSASNNGLTYDPAVGYPIVLADSQPSSLGGGGPRDTWAFSNMSWTNLGPVPAGLWSGTANGADPPAMTFDEKDGYSVLYATSYLTSGNNASEGDSTWVYSAGSWSDQKIAGPPGRLAPSMAFDAADGIVVLFGGVRVGTTNGTGYAWYQAETWIYSPPPVSVRLSLTVNPTTVCSLQSEGCGVGSDTARVDLTVAVVAYDPSLSSGADSGAGDVEYGPYEWLALPTITFLTWGGIAPAPNLAAAAECSTGNSTTSPCTVEPASATIQGETALTWNWSPAGVGLVNALRQGSEWDTSFDIQASGPPYSGVPIDACTTQRCIETGSGSIDGLFANLGFSPCGNTSRQADSLPLAMIIVLPPSSQFSPPTSFPPSPPPPSVALPQPVGVPLPTSLIPSPATGSPIVSAVASSGISITALAVGVLAAGATGMYVGRAAQRVPVQLRLDSGNRRSGESSSTRQVAEGRDTRRQV